LVAARGVVQEFEPQFRRAAIRFAARQLRDAELGVRLQHFAGLEIQDAFRRSQKPRVLVPDIGGYSMRRIGARKFLGTARNTGFAHLALSVCH